MADPFTIHIFVPDGDPDGVRIIDRMNWTGLGIVFRREDWPNTKTRSEFSQTGVYILVGFSSEDEDLPQLYIGQGDDVRKRLSSHYANKDFWDWGVAFVSTSGGLNRAHITWLEYALVKQANEAKRSKLENGNTPQEPNLSESEKADTKAFLKEVLQILPLVGLRAFERPRPVVAPIEIPNKADSKTHDRDTIIVPAKEDGFERVFLGENCWHAIRIAGGMLNKIKYIAAYQSQPISAITHVAEVDHIEPYGEGGKYKVVFKGSAQEIEPIKYGTAPSGAMQGLRYTSYEKLSAAKTLPDVL